MFLFFGENPLRKQKKKTQDWTPLAAAPNLRLVCSIKWTLGLDAALKNSVFLFTITAAGVVSCGGNNVHITSSTV